QKSSRLHDPTPETKTAAALGSLGRTPDDGSVRSRSAAETDLNPVRLEDAQASLAKFRAVGLETVQEDPAVRARLDRAEIAADIRETRGLLLRCPLILGSALTGEERVPAGREGRRHQGRCRDCNRSRQKNWFPGAHCFSLKRARLSGKPSLQGPLVNSRRRQAENTDTDRVPFVPSPARQ